MNAVLTCSNLILMYIAGRAASVSELPRREGSRGGGERGDTQFYVRV